MVEEAVGEGVGAGVGEGVGAVVHGVVVAAGVKVEVVARVVVGPAARDGPASAVYQRKQELLLVDIQARSIKALTGK